MTIIDAKSLLRIRIHFNTYQNAILCQGMLTKTIKKSQKFDKLCTPSSWNRLKPHPSLIHVRIHRPAGLVLIGLHIEFCRLFAAAMTNWGRRRTRRRNASLQRRRQIGRIRMATTEQSWFLFGLVLALLFSGEFTAKYSTRLSRSGYHYDLWGHHGLWGHWEVR